MADEEETELSEKQKREIAKWFLLNSPPGEIQYVAKGKVLSIHVFLRNKLKATPFTYSFT